MKLLSRTLAAAALLCASLFQCAPALAVINVLPVVTTTTATDDAGVITSGRRYVHAMAWNTAGTATILLEERKSDTATGAPWVVIKTMTNCDANGLDASSVPCSYSTLTPPARVRLRVSVCSGCSVNRLIQDVGQ